MGKELVEVWKTHKKFQILLLLQVLAVLGVFVSLFFPLEQQVVYKGAGQGEVTVPGLTFSSGVYEVEVEYRVAEGNDTAGIYVTNEDKGSKLLVNYIAMRSGNTGVRFQFWLIGGSDQIGIRTDPGSNSAVEVFQIRVSETHGGSRIVLFLLLVVCGCADGLWLYWVSCGKRPDGRKKRMVLLGLAGIVGVISIPLAVDYCLSGIDLLFHIIRIEGLKDGLLGGQFPVRIEPNWLAGHGYASAIFYSDLFLLVPAALRMIGFPILSAYKLSLLFYNVVTALVAYWCFRGCFRDEYAGLVGSMLYSWTPYRIFNLYGRAGYGEMLALCFFPILVYGLYRVFTEDVEDPRYGRNWMLLTVGFTCIFQSHTLSFEVASGMTALVCIVFLRRVFRKQTFLVMCKTVAATILLNLWFLLPFLDYMVSDNFIFENLGGQQTIQRRGLYLAHALFAFYRNGQNSHYSDRGMAYTDSIGTGFAVTMCVLAYVWLRFVKRYGKEPEGEENASRARFYGARMAVVGGLALLMSTNFFPWDWLQSRNAVFETLTSSMEYPFRVFVITVVCFVYVACEVVWMVRRKETRERACLVLAAVVGCSFLTTQYLLSATLLEKDPVWLYNPENMGTTYLDGGEYLKLGSDYTRYPYGNYTWEEGVDVTVTDDAETYYGNRNLKSSFYAVNKTLEEAYVEVPLINYKGYHARDVDTGGELEVETGENGRVRVLLPAGYEGEILVKYLPPWYWRIAEAVSLATLCYMLWKARNLRLRRPDREKKKKEAKR